MSFWTYIFATNPFLVILGPLVLLGTTVSGLWNLHDLVRSKGWRAAVQQPSYIAKFVLGPIVGGLLILGLIAALSFINSLLPDECYRNYTC